MRDPTTAAHLLGNLLIHIGQDNVLWGTDFDLVRLAPGSDPGVPQLPDRDELIDAHGYPQLTPELKGKVFGLNGARVYGVAVPEQKQKTELDPIERRKAAYREQADRRSRPLGPRTDREYEALLAERGGLPA